MPNLQTTYFHLSAPGSSHFIIIARNIFPLVKIRQVNVSKDTDHHRNSAYTYISTNVLHGSFFFPPRERAIPLPHPPDNEQLFYPQTNESSDKLASLARSTQENKIPQMKYVPCCPAVIISVDYFTDSFKRLHSDSSC